MSHKKEKSNLWEKIKAIFAGPKENCCQPTDKKHKEKKEKESCCCCCGDKDE